MKEGNSTENDLSEAASGSDRTGNEENIHTQITKATISQAVGTLIYPITSELAALEVRAIDAIKDCVKRTNKKKLGERNKVEIERISSDAEVDPSKLRAVTQLHSLLEVASKQDLESEELMSLWSSLIKRISQGEADIDLMIKTLSELSVAEAELLLQLSHKRTIYTNVHPLYVSLNVLETAESERLQQIAVSLKNKGLLTQELPVARGIIFVLFPIAALLVIAEYLRLPLEGIINVSSANNVILMGVAGAMFGIAMITKFRSHTRLTWLAKRLCAEAGTISEKFSG